MTRSAHPVRHILRWARAVLLACILAALPPMSSTARSSPEPPPITPENAGRLAERAAAAFLPWELVTALAWSPDGSGLAAAAGNSIYLYETKALLAGGAAPTHALSTGAFSHSLAFSPDGRRLATARLDGKLRIWDIAGGPDSLPAPLVIDAHRKGANCLAFSPDGLYLASGGNDGVVRVWDSAGGEPVSQIIGGTFAVPALAFEPQGQVVAIVNGGVVRLREAASGRMASTYYADTPLYSLAFDPRGEILAAGDTGARLRVWRLSAGAEAPAEEIDLNENAPPEKGEGLVWDLAFSPDGELLAAAAGDGSLRLWQAEGLTSLPALPAHTAPATSLAFSPDGLYLASGGLDAVLRLWAVTAHP